VLQKCHQMFQLDRLPIGNFLRRRPRGEFAEQRGVSALRMLRLPAFVAQVNQKVFDESLQAGDSVAVRQEKSRRKVRSPAFRRFPFANRTA